jgi:UDP-glucuronate 4-epimerase
MARYLVTGAAGFIASRVAALLLEQGHEVIGIDNLNNAYDIRLKQWRLQQLQGKPGFAFSRGDISDRVVIETLWRKHNGDGLDAVINLAARAGVRQSVENPYVYMETNAAGTLNLLELTRLGGVKKFVLASTSSLYGADNPRPFKEDARTDSPLSPYAATKKAAEVTCSTYHFLYGMDVTVLRYFTVYGPAGRPDMSLFRFVQRISEGKPITVYGDGSQ